MKSAWFFYVIFCSSWAKMTATSKLFGCVVTYSAKDCSLGDPPTNKLELTQKSLHYVDSIDGFDSTVCASTGSTMPVRAPTLSCIVFGFAGSGTQFELKFNTIDDSACASPENLNCAYEEQISKSRGTYALKKTLDGIPARCSIQSDDPTDPYINVWKCSNSQSKTFYVLKISDDKNDKIYSGTHFNVLLSLALLSTAFILILITAIYFSWRRRR